MNRILDFLKLQNLNNTKNLMSINITFIPSAYKFNQGMSNTRKLSIEGFKHFLL